MEKHLTLRRTENVLAEEAISGDTTASCYESTSTGLLWHKPSKDGPVPTLLTNFDSRIVSDTLVDNGADSWRLYTMEAELAGHRTTFEVPADHFAAMKWAAQHLGAQAIIYPGSMHRDHARAAIQLLSGDIPQHRVYAHLGWQRHDDQLVYLHSGGAIGTSGIVEEIATLPHELSPLVLHNPRVLYSLLFHTVSQSLLNIGGDPKHLGFVSA